MLKARGLKRKEIRQLRENGYNLTKIDPTKGDEIVDAVLETVFIDKKEQAELDELEYSECLKIFTEILKLTFGSEEQEKK